MRLFDRRTGFATDRSWRLKRGKGQKIYFKATTLRPGQPRLWVTFLENSAPCVRVQLGHLSHRAAKSGVASERGSRCALSHSKSFETLKGIPFSREHIRRLEAVGKFPKRVRWLRGAMTMAT